MKTKTIFKTLAFAMLMPTMLLTTACSSDDLVDTEGTETIVKKGYTLPVTVNVTRQGDEATTRAAYNESTRKLEFSAGDKLFVRGDYDSENSFAGTLDYDSETGKFSGTITTQTEWTGTAEELLAGADAQLLPAGYEGYGFINIDESEGYDDALDCYYSYAFATSKAAAIEQFSNEYSREYSNGFALTPYSAILNFTITGLTASTEVDVEFESSETTVSEKVTTDDSGNATFAIGVPSYTDFSNCSLTVGGNAIALASGSKTLAPGKIYNINRSAAPVGISAASADGTTGTYTDANGVKREGIVVTLGSSKYLIATANETDLTGITAETSTKTVDGITYYTWANACTKFANGVTDGTYTTANVWRLPTQAELTALVGLTSTWDSTNKGYNWTIGSASLFLPAAGDCNNGNAGYVGGLGLYWSSTPDDEYSAYRLNFGSHYSAEVDIAGRDYGFTVRLFCQLPSE